MFIPLACVSRLSFFSVSLVQLSFFVYVFVSLYIYIYLRLILFSLIPYVFLLFYYPYNQCFRFSYVANYILPVFDHNLAYSTHFYIFPNLLYSVFNRLSVFFVFSFYHFLIFLAQSFFFLFFFFCICLSCLSTCVLFVIFDLTAAAYNSRETNIRSMIQHFQFYLCAIWEISMFNNNLLIEIYINLLNFNSNCICLTFILLEIILEPYSIDNKINLCYP